MMVVTITWVVETPLSPITGRETTGPAAAQVDGAVINSFGLGGDVLEDNV